MPLQVSVFIGLLQPYYGVIATSTRDLRKTSGVDAAGAHDRVS